MSEHMLDYLCDGDRSLEYPQLREIFMIQDVIDGKFEITVSEDSAE